MKRENNIAEVTTPSLAYLLDQATIVTDSGKSHTIAFIHEKLAKQFIKILSTKNIIPIGVIEEPNIYSGMLYSILLEDYQLKYLMSLAKGNPVQPTSDNLLPISTGNNTKNDKELRNQWTDRNVTGNFSILPFDMFKNHILGYLFPENLYELRLLNRFFYKLLNSFISNLRLLEDEQLIQYEKQKFITRSQEKLKRYEVLLVESKNKVQERFSSSFYSETKLDNLLFMLFLSSVHFLTFMMKGNQQLDDNYITRWNKCFSDAAHLLSSHFLDTDTQWNQHFVAKEFFTNYQSFKLYTENSDSNLLLFSSGHANFWQYFWLTLREIHYLQEEFNNIASFLINFDDLKNKLSSTPDSFWEMFFKGISKLKSFKNTNYLLNAMSEHDMTTPLYKDKNFLEVFHKSMSSNGVASVVFFFRYFSSSKSNGLSFIFSQPASCQFYFDASKLLKNSSSLYLLTLIDIILPGSFSNNIKALPKSPLFWAYWIVTTHQWEKHARMEYFRGHYISTICKVSYSEKDYLKKLTLAIKNQIEFENNNYQQNGLLSAFFQPRSFSDMCKKLFEIADHPGQRQPIVLFTSEKEFDIFIEYAAYIDLLIHKSAPQHPIDQVWHILQKRFYKKFNKAMRNLAFQKTVIQKIVDYHNPIAQNESEKFQELKSIIHEHVFGLHPLNSYEHKYLLKLWALFGYIEDYTKNEKIDKELPKIYKEAYDFIRYETYDYAPPDDGNEKEKKGYRYYSSSSDTWIMLNEKQHNDLLLNNSKYMEYRTLDYIINSPFSTKIYKKFSSDLNFYPILSALKEWNSHFELLLKNSDRFLITLPFSTPRNDSLQNSPDDDVTDSPTATT